MRHEPDRRHSKPHYRARVGFHSAGEGGSAGNTTRYGTTERDKLSGQLLDARQKITVLGEQITRLTNERDEARQQLQRRLKQPEVDRLPPESEKMLLTLANAEEGASSEMLIQQLGLPKAKGDYFFDQLRKRHLVQATYSDDVALFFRATEAGREYLAKANLL